jgi:hypothetical protein
MKKIIALLLIVSILISGIVFTSIITEGQQSRGAPPNISTTDVTTATVGVHYKVEYRLSNYDYNLTYSWKLNTNASWLTSSKGNSYLVIYGTPHKTDVGSYWVNVTVSNISGSDSAFFTLTVLNSPTPLPPKITKLNIEVAFENTYYSRYYTARDWDNIQNHLTWSMNTNASWLSFSNKNLYGTPATSDIGQYWVYISVSDGNSTDSTNFTLTVYEKFPPPTITTTDVLSATVGVLYWVQYEAFDPDSGFNLTWTFKSNATWLSFSASQDLWGTPSISDLGSYWVDITVSDNASSDNTFFTLTVYNAPTSYPPSMSKSNIQTAYAEEYYHNKYNVVDWDTLPEDLIWTFKTSANFLYFSSKVLFGTPSLSDLGQYWVYISVSDGNNSDFTNFTLTVKRNNPPYITNSNVLTAYAGKEYRVSYHAKDPDPKDYPTNLTWTMTTNASWLSFSYQPFHQDTLYGNPKTSDIGTYWVNITVSDTHDYSFTNFTITVLASPPSNKPPKITTTDVLTAYTGKYYSVNYTATDPDTNQNDLVWTLSTNASWLSLSSSGHLAGTPALSDVGTYYVKVTVSDGLNIDSNKFNLAVIKSTTSTAPTITTKDVTTANTGYNYSVSYKASDPDTPQNKLTWTMKTNASWLSFSSGQVLSGTPSVSDIGSYWVNITVSDGTNSDFTFFTLNVQKSIINPAPKIKTNNVLVAYVDKLYSVNYSAYDPDTPLSQLKWTLNTNAKWLSFSASRVLSGTPTASDVGYYWVRITVSDGNNTDVTNFNITVQTASSPSSPSITSSSTLPDSTDVSIDTTEIVITFSKSMDPTRVESALKITPGIDHSLSWNENGDELTISFDAKFEFDTEYSITIDRSALDSEGNNLESEYNLNFNTEKDPGTDKDKDTKPSETEGISSLGSYGLLGISLIAILIFFLLAFMFLIKKRKKVVRDQEDGRVPYVAQPGTVEPAKLEIQNTALDTSDNADNILKEVTAEALRAVKPGTVGPSKEYKLDGFRDKLEKGEITRETYDEAVEIISKPD